MKSRNPERDKKIRAMRAQGLSLSRIGSKFRLSQERIRQICGEANSPSYFKYYDTKHPGRSIANKQTPIASHNTHG